MAVLSLPLGCSPIQSFLGYKPCKAVQVTGVLQLYISTVKIITRDGNSYVIKESEDCRYDCPKPEGGVPYIRLGKESEVAAYCPIGNKFIYTIRGCVDETKHNERILYANFISYRKK
jgi:hypothetical protein